MADVLIKRIDKKSVHQICSGQVILSLAVAVKELVENGLDAGATCIDVRLKDHGADCVEVADDGCGIEPANFDALAKKHHTSKLKDFEDLSSIGTFGFRGEALSSLCALSDLTVVTRSSTQEVATRIEYDANGVVKAKTSVARETGTTVYLQRLFHSLPVRHREFQKNLKKEFNKMVSVLQGYCIVSTGVRISCHNQTSSNKKQLILATNGNATIRENLMNVFGAKQIQQLVEITTCDLEDVKRLGEEYSGLTEGCLDLFRLSGYISRCNHGYGRSSTDRQYFFINKRPCDHTKLSKVVNEVYHLYNRHQYPCVVLCVDIQQESVDVNVTPDKRQIFIQQEKILLAVVKATILKTLEPMAGQYDLNQSQAHCSGQTLAVPRALENVCHEQRDQMLSCRLSGVARQEDNSCTVKEKGSSRPSSMSALSGLKRSFGYNFESVDHKIQPKTDTNEPNVKQRKLFDCGFATLKNDEDLNSIDNTFTVSDNNDNVTVNIVSELVTTKGEETPTSLVAIDDERPPPDVLSTDMHLAQHRDEETGQIKDLGTSEISPVLDLSIQSSSSPNLEQVVHVNLEAVRQRLSVAHKCPPPYSPPLRRQFKAKITPDGSQEAESELRREISKDMFRKMEVVGQFNLGFIIGRLGSNLFIIDQHATDEKYNFERLQRETVLEHQKLIKPLDLEFTAVQEMVVMENLKIFSANGFEFQINTNAPPTERVKLIGQPVSKNWKFGPDDVSELVFLLSDSPGEMCRPSRVSSMFASRACRSSIMIGTALSKSEMKKLLQHMSTLEHPWNCPHGRPTMRHLVDLSMLNSTLDQRTEIESEEANNQQSS